MATVFWILLIVVTVVCTAFTVNNPHNVAVDFWPLARAELPLFAIVLAAVALGFIFGAIVAWFGFGRTRRRMREKSRQLETAGREVAVLKRRVEKFEEAEKQAALPPPSATAA